jgi:hypothetical protein
VGQANQPDGAGGDSAAAQAESWAPAWQISGGHRYYRRDDTMFWECHGSMQRSDLVVLFDERMALQRQWGRVFVLFDAREMDSVSPEGRRFAIQFRPDPPLCGAVVVFGAGLLARTALSLIIAAARLMGRQDNPSLLFASTEAEAWAALERERAALSTRQPP